MKYFLHKLILLATPIFTLLISVNYFGDATNLFDEDYENKMVNILNEKKYVTNISNYKERIFQKIFINSLKFTPNTVVFGSSRSRSINSDMLQKGTLINNSVSGASIEDIIGLFQIYKDKKRIPDRIILGIDPWTFNENNGQKRWKSISKYYYKFKKSYNQQLINTSVIGQLVFLSYFQKSFKQLLKENKEPVATSVKINSTNTMLFDGSNVKSYSVINIEKRAVDDAAYSYINGNRLYGIANFNSISNRILKDFELLLSELELLNIEVWFFLSPYHPIVYKKIQDAFPNVLYTEKIIKKIGKSRGIKIYGSFNPEALGMDGQYFFDGMHCQESGIKKILSTNN
jgi:hypothetical protein